MASACKICCNKKTMEYGRANAEKRKVRYFENLEEIKKKQQEYRIANRKRLNEHALEYSRKNKDEINRKRKESYAKNRSKILERNKEYAKRNAEKIASYRRKYRSHNSENISKHKLLYVKKRRDSDPLYAMACRIRWAIWWSISNLGYAKRSKSFEILGCSWDEFKIHIESQFVEGMSWVNRGDWHIDHYYPLSKARDEAHLLELNHYTNLRPMWAIDNIRKRDKIPNEFIANSLSGAEAINPESHAIK